MAAYSLLPRCPGEVRFGSALPHSPVPRASGVGRHGPLRSHRCALLISEKLTGEQGSKTWRPHQSGDIRAPAAAIMEHRRPGRRSIVDHHAAVSDLRLGLASPQIEKYLALCLYASHNTFIQQFFDPLTVYRNKTGYVAGEFGAALLLISITMALYFWRRRDEVEGDNRQASTF